MNKPSLSFSAFECYTQCPFKFKKLYIERIRMGSNEYAMFGSAFHSLLEQTYIDNDFVLSSMLKKWPAIFAKEASKSSYDKVSIIKKKKQEDRGVKETKTWFNMASEHEILRPCLEHEVNLQGNFKHHILKAKVDLVTLMRGGVGIIDWKTGNPDHKNLMQLVLYAILYEKKTGTKVAWVVPFYTKVKKVVYQECDKNIVKEASQYFSKIYNELVVDNEFKPIRNTNCFFCEFNTNGVCPLGQETRELAWTSLK